jgi:hypothetical protein
MPYAIYSNTSGYSWSIKVHGAVRINVGSAELFPDDSDFFRRTNSTSNLALPKTECTQLIYAEV